MNIVIAGKKSSINKNSYAISLSEKNVDGKIVCADGKNLLEIAIPKKEKVNLRAAFIVPRKIVFFAKKLGIKNVVLNWDDVKNIGFGDDQNIAEIFATNFEMAHYDFVSLKTAPEEGWPEISQIEIIVDKKELNSMGKAIKKGVVIGRKINESRDLSNMPGGLMTPAVLAKAAKDAAKGTKISVKVHAEQEIKKYGMNGILAVGGGSKERPCLIEMNYAGSQNKNKKPIVLIGKGVTFDSGGLNIKPGDHMLGMNMDMSGGAAVIQAISLAATLGIKRNIIALIPAVESMPSGESLRPGDVIKTMSGKTIEVLNTDAEGRIILAEANTFAERFKPSLVLNVSTLTGAALVALGERASAIMSKDKKLTGFMEEMGEQSGDFVWPLPFWDEYEEEIKGTIADVCNTKNRANSRDGGTILGGMFIYQFAKKFPAWAHIDIAPRMLAVYDEFLSPGSAGAPIRLLIKIMEHIDQYEIQ